MKRLTKEEIQALALFKGVNLDKITVVTTEDGALSAISQLIKCHVIGFDTETKPIFQKGEKISGPQIIQLSSLKKHLFFQHDFHLRRELLMKY